MGNDERAGVTGFTGFCDMIDAYYEGQRQAASSMASSMGSWPVKHRRGMTETDVRVVARQQEQDREAEHRAYIDRHNERAKWLASRRYGGWVPVLRDGEFESVLHVCSRNGFRPVSGEVVFQSASDCDLAIVTILRSGYWCGSGGSWMREQRGAEAPWSEDRKKLLLSVPYQSGRRAGYYDAAPNAWWSSWGYAGRPGSLYRLNVRNFCRGTDHVVMDYDPERGTVDVSGDFR